MKKSTILFVLFLLPILIFVEESVRTWIKPQTINQERISEEKSVRTWTKLNGEKLVGKWEMEKDTDEEKIHIRYRSDGKLYRVKVDKLSESDQAYVAKKRAGSRSAGETVFEEAVPHGMQVVPKNHRYALLVGINEYTRPFESLKYCDADMEALEKVLLELDFPPENIVRLSTSARNTSHLPTKANILRHARLLAEEVDENGLFIMAFSGHGASYGDKSYFCPMDTAHKDLSSLVKRSDVYKIVENCSAKQKLVFVDACRNSLVMEGWRAADGIKGLVDPVGIEKPGFFIISSCRTGQFSWEDQKLGHGVFTHFLIEGLQGKAAQDGQISVHGLFSYVNLQTKRYVRLNFEDSQIPLLRGDEDELDDFLIAKLEKQPIPKPTEEPTYELTPPEPPKPAFRTAGERMVKTVDGIEYAFRWCPAGTFTMGDEECYETPHSVTLTKGFWMLETEVTQAMWKSVMGTDPSGFKGTQNPVESVSWNECQEFCRKLSGKLGLTVSLPTEAQERSAYASAARSVPQIWSYVSNLCRFDIRR